MPAVTATRLSVPLTPPQAVARTSAELCSPHTDGGGPAFVLGHGAGSNLAHPTLQAVARGVAERGYPVLLFNFAYAEAGRRRPDPAVRLEAAYRDAIAEARRVLGPDRPLVLGGRSMGGRIATHLAADGVPGAGVVLLGYPLHAPRASGSADGERPGANGPERLRTDHWPRLRVPLLFVSGDRDRLCDLDLLERERRTHLTGAPNRVHILAGADHGFAVRKRDGRTRDEVLAEVVDVVAAWTAALPEAGGR